MSRLKSIFQILFPIIIFAIFALVFTFPGLTKINSAYLGVTGDSYQYSAFQTYLHEQILQGKFHYGITPHLRYPFGVAISSGVDGLFSTYLGALLQFVVHPILAYNLTVYLILIVNCLAAYWLSFHLSRSRPIATLSGITYGFSFYVLARAAAHPNLEFVAGFPIVVLGLELLRSKINIRNLAVFWLGVLLCALGSLQYLIILTIFLFFYFIIRAFSNIGSLPAAIKTLKNHLPEIVVSFSVFGLIFLFVYFPNLWSLITGTFSSGNRESVFAGTPVGLWELFLPNRFLHLWFVKLYSSPQPSSIESVAWIGLLELLFLVLFFLRRNNFKEKILWLCLFLFFIFLTSGYGYPLLMSIPLFKFVPETSRFIVIINLCVLVAMTQVLNTIKDHRRFALVVCLTGFGILAERFTPDFPVTQTPRLEYQEVVSRLPGQAVLDLPLDIYDPASDLLPIVYHKNIISGFTHWSNNTPLALSFITDPVLNRFICDPNYPFKPPVVIDQLNMNREFIKKLEDLGVSAIVVHKDSKILYLECQNSFSRINLLLPPTLNIEDTQTNVVNYFHEFPAWPQLYFKVYFPKSGHFMLNGSLISPQTLLPVSISYNDIPLEGYTWKITPNGLELDPKDKLNFDVSAGSSLIFSSPRFLFQTIYFSLWYTFTPSDDVAPVNDDLELIYDDDFASVYRLSHAKL